jgi:hypothetical protein
MRLVIRMQIQALSSVSPVADSNKLHFLCEDMVGQLRMLRPDRERLKSH